VIRIAVVERDRILDLVLPGVTEWTLNGGTTPLPPPFPSNGSFALPLSLSTGLFIKAPFPKLGVEA
jgi:hypothetical protein